MRFFAGAFFGVGLEASDPGVKLIAALLGIGCLTIAAIRGFTK